MTTSQPNSARSNVCPSDEEVDRLLSAIYQIQEVQRMTGNSPRRGHEAALRAAVREWHRQNTHETGECHIRPHDLCSGGTCKVCVDAERFRWLQEAVDRNDRFSVYEHGTKVFELRTAIDTVRGVSSQEPR